jgi:flagellar biosynthesis activator protein FlaF
MNGRYWTVYATQLEEYRTNQNLNLSGREIEAAALMQAAFKIKECQDNWNAADREAKLNEAFRVNQTIWSILQGELIKEDNPLPKQIKEDLLRLSVFIDKRIFDVMLRPSPEKLTILIEINLNIAAGLNKNQSNNNQAVAQVLPMPQKNVANTNVHV